MSETLPPIVPSPNAGNAFRSIARASWIAPLIGLAANFLLVVSGNRTAIVSVFISVVFLGGGFLLGAIALFGVVKHGRKGILVPALTGISIPMLLSVLAIPNIYSARQRVLRHRPPEAPVHLASARLLKDETFKFSMDIPDGFLEWNGGGGQNFLHCYARPLSGSEDARLVVSIQQLNGAIPPNNPLRREDVANRVPPGVKVDLVEKNWRGFRVDTIVAEVAQGEGKVVSFGTQVPLTPVAIQINVAGPVSHRAEIDKLTDQILMSLEGLSNWEVGR